MIVALSFLYVVSGVLILLFQPVGVMFEWFYSRYKYDLMIITIGFVYVVIGILMLIFL
jgi:hypothetical protein